jgi:hypothetical protein
LLGALIVVGKRIRQLNFGGRDDQALSVLQRVLREAAERYNLLSYCGAALNTGSQCPPAY